MRILTKGVLALVLSLALIISMFPPLELIDYAYWALSTNFNAAPEVFIMSSDILILLAGFFLAYSIKVFLIVGRSSSISLAHFSSWFGLLNRSFNRKGAPSLVAAALLILYWHIPSILDAAVLQFGLHLIMHASLLLAGLLIFVGASCLSGTMRMMAALLAHMAMGIFGVILLVTSGYRQFYTVYPLEEQVQLGLVMVIMMFIVEGTLVPYWLYQYFTKPIVTVNA
jgi:cytochrome c oxidase assembly factor CtaG